MFSLRTHAIICAALFAALFGIAILGNVLAAAGVIHPPSGAGRTLAVSLFFGLFLAAGLSAVPVMVKLVVGAQKTLGNQGVPVIGATIRGQNVIIWAIWALMLAGLAVALPATIAAGFFGPGPQAFAQRTAEQVTGGPKLGRLAARPGMTVAEVAAASSLRLDVSPGAPVIAGGGNSTLRFPALASSFRARATSIWTTYPDDRGRVQAMNIGVSPAQMSRAALAAANLALRRRLARDGWLAGHEVYRDAEDVVLHGGATRGPEGRSWLKDGMVLDVESRRVDDEQPGEDPTTAGEWIQYIEVWPRKDYAGVDRLVFQPAEVTGAAAAGARAPPYNLQ